MCLLPKLTHRQYLRRKGIEIVVLVVLLSYMASGFLQAQPQSQDYLNGQFTEQIHNLDARLQRFEAVINYVAAGVFGTLGIQLWNVLLHFQREKARRDDD